MFSKRILVLAGVLEESLDFNISNDSDYPSHRNNMPSSLMYIASSASEQYIETQDAIHGKESHAIKHLIDLNDSDFNSFIQEAKNIILDFIKNQEDLDGIFLKDNNTVVNQDFEITEDLLSVGVICNTLDVVNDKMKLGEELIGVHLLLTSIVDKFASSYEKAIEDIISNDLFILDAQTNKFKKQSALHKNIVAQRNLPKSEITYYFNLKPMSEVYFYKGIMIVIGGNGKVTTAFRPVEKGSMFSMMKKTLEQHANKGIGKDISKFDAFFSDK